MVGIGEVQWLVGVDGADRMRECAAGRSESSKTKLHRLPQNVRVRAGRTDSSATRGETWGARVISPRGAALPEREFDRVKKFSDRARGGGNN